MYTEKNNIPEITLFIDFRKAFRIPLNGILLTTVQKNFNFGPDIQNWVKILYKNVSNCILNNAYMSEFFPLERDVRQGCPLSRLLFWRE